MSNRTIVEINHDYLSQLERTEDIIEFLRALRSSDHSRYAHPGIRILGQRHHSETLVLEVK